MEKESARQIIAEHQTHRPSEIGEAVDFFYKEHKSYTKIAKIFGVSADRLSAWHCIAKLPKGIQWKVDCKVITISQGCQIAKLDNKDDQWLFAFVLVETKAKMTTGECKIIITAVVKGNTSMKDALAQAGVRFDTSPQPLLLPLDFNKRFALSKVAWKKHKKLEDFCWNAIQASKDIDNELLANRLDETAGALTEMAKKLRTAGDGLKRHAQDPLAHGLLR